MNHKFNHLNKDTEIVGKESEIDVGVLSSTQTFSPSITSLNFPFDLKDDQIAAVNPWMTNNNRGTILYSTGTGKTEIAFECAKRLAGRHLSPKGLESLAKVDGLNNNDLILKNKGKDISVPKQIEIAADTNREKDVAPYSFFNVLFLVPRISLIDQTVNRLVSYGIRMEKVGVYFGERKEKKEIMICTYHSVIRNSLLIRRSNMVIFDEVHLIRDTSKSFVKIFDIVVEDPKKAILGHGDFG